MQGKAVTGILVVFFIGVASVDAKEGHISLNDIINKMKKELNLTDEQVDAIKPIVKESVQKREALWNDSESQAVFNKSNFRTEMNKLKEEENKKLSKILSEDQMKKLIEKQ